MGKPSTLYKPFVYFPLTKPCHVYAGNNLDGIVLVISCPIMALLHLRRQLLSFFAFMTTVYEKWK